ncbi:hypothetical protein [Streptomyces cyaneofuscatus]|uniref:hypothetical protein n=1 Tax=Streptomyces TaxID=1883 RepID=UPI002E1231DE|nr:hypothetical protein OG366_01690 [Streptomyces cyaneofuscatus]WTF39629.1 hypothetical protein OG973_34855 [Streptomyces cyaneofuscatus]
MTCATDGDSTGRRSVDQALKEIAVTHGGMDADEASAYVRRLASDRRYVRDVY